MHGKVLWTLFATFFLEFSEDIIDIACTSSFVTVNGRFQFIAKTEHNADRFRKNRATYQNILEIY